MNNNKSRILSRLLWCLLAIVLVIVICYLVYSCRLLNSDDVSRDYFSGKKYLSTDKNYYIYFSNDVSTFTLDMQDATYNDVAITDYYENMIFFILDGEDYVIAVINESMLFLSNERAYLYLLQ